MDVDGISVAAAEALDGQLIANVVVNPAGHLIFTRKNGETIDAGLVKRPPIDAWPVGSVYTSVTPGNPADILGAGGYGGTWTPWGAGRVPVGVATGDPDFGLVEQTGGTKTVTLTAAQMPYHQHTGTTGTESAVHTHAATVFNGGAHFHEVLKGDGNVVGNAVGRVAPGNTNTLNGPANTTTNGEHNHAIGINTQSAGHTHAFTTDGAGSGAAHSNVQPYITCYMWKRLPDPVDP